MVPSMAGLRGSTPEDERRRLEAVLGIHLVHSLVSSV